MFNATLSKFGAPDTLIGSTEHWRILLRPQQITLGSLILGAHSEATAFGDLSVDAMADLQRAIGGIERMLNHCFQYQKINYLMLMMVDPHVHFHVFPRYADAREFAGHRFHDVSWPGPPRLDQVQPLSAEQLRALKDHLGAAWADQI